jgi:glycosyltransferase involved in cell wall biosynthesis
MKIGIIVGNIGPTRSGMENYVFNLTKELKKNTAEELTLIASDNNPVIGKLPTRVPRYPLPVYVSVVWSQAVSIQKKMFADFDVVHNPTQFPIFTKLGKHSISTIHDITPVLFPQWHPRWRSFIYRVSLPRLIASSDKIIAVSEQTKNDIISYYKVPGAKIAVIYEGASAVYKPLGDAVVKDIRLKYHLDFPFVLFVGNLEPRKNIPTVLKSFHQCRKKMPNIKLVIVGKKRWMYQDIFTTLDTFKLRDAVMFLDYVPHEDLPPLYNAAKVFVYVPFYEGFGLPVLEAMQCGTPVITSNISSLPEIAGDSGVMVNPLDIAGLAEKMTQLISDDHLREENIRYNLTRCRLFSWEKCAEETAELYKEVYSKF